MRQLSCRQIRGTAAGAATDCRSYLGLKELLQASWLYVEHADVRRGALIMSRDAAGDLLGLNNLVANTAYLKAQQVDSKELRRQRLCLALPRLRRTSWTNSSSAVSTSVLTDFQSLCEQQPIGKKLFRQFLLASGPQYAAAAEFLDELSRWDFRDGAEDGGRDETKLRVLNKLMQPKSHSFLFYLKGDGAAKYRGLSENLWDEETVEQLREATRDFLKGEPFEEYLKSSYFCKFLQWKELERQKITRKYFYEFRTLGKGGFGEVCAVQVKHTGQMYACKKLHKGKLKKKGGERLAILEKHILEKVDSLFVVNLAYAFESETHLCLIMDLMNGGDLKFHIYELGKRGLRMARVVHYVAQIIMGILHLHSMDIVYRDMKPENVLLDARGHCRLSDLGLAVELPKGKKICQKAGTTGYMAPEILRQENYSTSVDWWAFGCSIYEMVAARLPFKDFKEKVQNEEVTRRTLEEECKYDHKHFDQPTKDIISRFLRKKVQNRLGCRGDDPRKHFFFNGVNFLRLEAGQVDPPWVPKPNVVYAKNLDELRDTSDVENVKFDAKDEMFFREFSTGAVTTRWQKEMIDSGVFDELNGLETNGNRGAAVASSTCVLL